MNDISAASETVLILDFGSQYTQLIARRCREEGVFSLIDRWDVPAERIRQIAPIGLILSGGPDSVYDEGAPQRWDDLAALGIPILGICYGMQLMARGEGGVVSGSGRREYGRAYLDISGGRLLEGLSGRHPVWMSHGDRVERLPDRFVCTGVSDGGIAAMERRDRGLFGVQFHPEVSHTPSGERIIRNFLYNICGARGGWDMGSFARQAIENVRRRVGRGRVICAFSGGVDSAVAAAIARRAVGDRLRCICVDTGLLRLDEARQIDEMFRPLLGDSLEVVDASERFFQALKGVTDPEEKRRRIGAAFIEVFTRAATRFDGAQFLLQGTIYPDFIESSGGLGTAAVIKTHHNVGGLPAALGLELVEPLKELFKDEVRRIGRELNLAEDAVMRHPFPGPGLAVRILGEVTPQAVKLLQRADAIFIEELRLAGWYNKVSQAFAVLLPVKSVGVMGDARTYEQVVALRSVDTRDFMTADFSPFPYELLGRVASRIVGEVRGINRVVYDITSKPPGTVEWE